MPSYLGVLPAEDPLHGFLQKDVLEGALGLAGCAPVFDMYALTDGSTLCRYVDRQTGADVVGKFYGNKWLHGRQDGEPELRTALMWREFHNLERVRALGLDAPPRCVVRPLAASEEHNRILVEEHAPGLDLETHVREAAQSGQGGPLAARLAEVVRFLSDLHGRSRTEESLDPGRALGALDRYSGQLAHWKVIGEPERERLVRLGERWADSGILAAGRRVLVHGDATPLNFIHDIHDGEHRLTVIDLERLWLGDPAEDLGCLVAELKHLFFWYAHEPWGSEPYIQNVYGTYASCQAGDEDFGLLTERGRFHMGCVLLRIARNSWLDLDYRRRLVEIAETCLQI